MFEKIIATDLSYYLRFNEDQLADLLGISHFVLLRVRDDRDQVRQQRLEMRSAAAAPPGFTPARRQSVPAVHATRRPG